jgi:fibronectin-binding autotransporter adhesin
LNGVHSNMAIFKTSENITVSANVVTDNRNFLTWDSNGASAGQTDGAGAWLGANQWWNSTTNQAWVNDRHARFGWNNGNAGSVTVASPITVNSIVFRGFVGSYTIGTAGQTISLVEGMEKNPGSGTATIISPITIIQTQSWKNESSTLLTIGTANIDNGGNLLTIGGDGVGNVKITGVISGAGGLITKGTNLLTIGDATAPVHTYSGPTSILGGGLLAASNLPNGNLVLNGGTYEFYATGAISFIRPLGAGTGEVQIPGGASGFGINVNQTLTVRINNDATTEMVWGSTYFNPSELVFHTTRSGASSTLTFDNKIDLQGAVRNIRVNNYTATLPQIIRDTIGGGGLIKTGVGTLLLTANNSFTGGLVINAGVVSISTSAQSFSGGIIINDGANLTTSIGTGLNNNAITANRNASYFATGAGGITSTGGIILNSGSNLTIANNNSTYTTTGAVIGEGGITLGQTGGGQTFVSFNSTANTFTGVIDYTTGAFNGTLNVNSFADSATPGAGNIRFGLTGAGAIPHVFAYGTGAIVPLVITNRQFEIGGTTNGNTPTISNNSGQSFTVNSNLAVTGTGTRTLTLSGTGAGISTFAGNIANGNLTTLSVIKTGSCKWILSGTNTYTGTTINGFNGMQAISPSTSIQQTHNGGAGGFGTILFLDNSEVPASRATVNINMISSNTNHFMTVYVDRIDGSNTGSTIILGNLNFTQTVAGNTGQTLYVTGANSYKFQLSKVNLPATVATTTAWTGVLAPTTANLLIAGNIQQIAGTVAGTITLDLAGTATVSVISGNILDSADASPRVLALTKTDTSTWTLSGTNTYTGPTTVNGSGGTLRINGSITSNVTVTLGEFCGPDTTGASSTVTGTVIVANNVNAILDAGDFGNNIFNTGSLTFNGTSSRLRVHSTTTEMGKIAVTGNVALGGCGIVFNAGIITNGTYKIITCTGIMSGTLPTIITNNTGKTLVLQQTGNDLEVVVS